MQIKQCKVCRKNRPITDYKSFIGGRDPKNKKTYFFGKCNPCLRAYERSLYWRYPIKSREKLLIKRIKNKKNILESNARSKRKNRDKERLYAAASRKRNREKRRLVGKIIWQANKKMPIEILAKKQNNKCFYCKDFFTKKPERDHVIPLSRGGTNKISNMVAACSSCNRRKSTMLLTEYKLHCKTMGYKLRL